MLKINLICIIIAFFIDMLIGDPHNIPHPIRYMGKSIAYFENIFREYALFRYSDYRREDFKEKNSFLSYIYYKLFFWKNKKIDFEKNEVRDKTLYNRALCIYGYFIVAINIFIWTLIPLIAVIILYQFHKYLFIVAYSFLLSQLIAARGLYEESMKVYYALKKDDMEGAKKALSMIVGRDTDRLDKEGIIKAAIETVAENFSDGVIAPLIYIFLGGILGGYVYKVINTMDSMLGYKDEKYLYIGRAAAKTDDIFNFLPSRISALFMIFGSFILGFDTKNAIKIFLRDRFNHASPNSAQTEAVAAGALRIKLAGDTYYFGKLYKKKSIGDDIRPPVINDIKAINRMMYISSLIGIILIVVIYLII